MLDVGQIVPLVIEKPAVGGRMLARIDGRVVLVGGTIPGERVRARVTALAKGLAYADTIEVLDVSPDRREPPCDPACGGSLYAHIAYPAQLSIKAAVVADALGRIGRLPLATPVPVVESPTDGYRMRARLHLRGGRLGFFREETQTICDARPTKQLQPASHDALDEVVARFARPDMVAEIELSESVDGTERVVHVESTTALSREQPDGSGIPGLTGLLLTGRSASGISTRVVAGVPWVVDRLEVVGAPLALRRHVRSFFQGNRFLLASLASHVVALIPDRARVIDLYAGVGLFGLAAAAVRGTSGVAVEGDRHAAADLEANVRGHAAIESRHESVEAFLARWRQPRPDAVVLDPPRTGVSKEAVERLVRLQVPLIVYVSCDVATLARDTRRLVDGGYAIDSVLAFDLFPNTPHVETVMALRRT